MIVFLTWSSFPTIKSRSGYHFLTAGCSLFRLAAERIRLCEAAEGGYLLVTVVVYSVGLVGL